MAYENERFTCSTNLFLVAHRGISINNFQVQLSAIFQGMFRSYNDEKNKIYQIGSHRAYSHVGKTDNKIVTLNVHPV